MYLENANERMQTILSGIPISAENIRITDQQLGKQWQGTSWFFLMHVIAKTFTKVEKIPFASVAAIPQDYGIENWIDPDSLRKQLNTLSEVFAKRGLGNVNCNADGDLSIDGIISHKELNEFADQQYDYSMGAGLVRYSPHLTTGFTRSTANFAERIWWHYITALYQSPKIYDSSEGDNYLNGLTVDLKDRLSQKNLVLHSMTIWD